MTKEVIHQGKAEVIRPDENGIPERKEVPIGAVIKVGNKIVSATKRRELGAVDQDPEPDITITRTPSTRWGLPEDPPGRARLLG
ncbi:MAG: hypothetical protein H6799_02585 [Candidatus Nomurabacteria bacterium]|nr:MAG: hypothetical protein H6799_02585 [Candidatus Nomurabacteria bacterium]